MPDTSQLGGQRYARHLLLPGVGLAGQQRLAASRVLVVGAGGLGSAALLYLAAAGVGTLGVVDDDVVDVTNLQRQVVHTDADTGRAKVDSAADALARLNPTVRVLRHRQRLTSDTAEGLVAAYQLVVDGSDNFATRYVVGQACARAGIPHVWASVLRFDAQVSVWWAGHGPCYRCVFPHEPAAGEVPSCAEAGVLGALCGVVGSVQATEALKLLLGIGEPLIGRLLLHDALAQTWDTIPVRADPRCPTCASAPAPVVAVPQVAPVPIISAGELADLLGAPGAPPVLDVRTAAERAVAAIPGSVGMPLADFVTGHAIETLAAAVAAHGSVVLYCGSGIRSEQAARLASDAGWPGVRHLEGGIAAWLRQGLPVDPGAPPEGNDRAAPGREPLPLPEHAERILELARTIPPGRVATYGDLAAWAGVGGARQVGQVMSRYGSDAPWWRVLRAGGLPPQGLAVPALRHYLREGTALRGNPPHDYRVDLRVARWRP